MSNHPHDQRFSTTPDRYATQPSRDQDRDADYDITQKRGWQQDSSHPRNFGSSYGSGSGTYGGGDPYSTSAYPGNPNYAGAGDDYAYGAHADSVHERLEYSNQNMPAYRGRGQHREPWPRNEDRENYASVAGYEDRNYPSRTQRHFDDEARAANRFARPLSNQRFAQNRNFGHRDIPTASYYSASNYNPGSNDPRNAGNLNYAEPKYTYSEPKYSYSEPKYYGDDSGYGHDLNYAQNYSPNYSPRYSQGYERWQSSGNVQGWQERDDAQVGAFGIQSHRGKGPRGYTRSDERVREDVCERLSAHHYIDASALTVEVKDGVVTLEGSVDDRWQKYQAEDLIDATSGVKDINNRLTIRRAGQTETRGDGSEKSKAASAPGARSQSSQGPATHS